MADESLKLTGVKMEYTFLREQFLKRVEMRHTVVELTLTIAAAFLGVAFTKAVPSSIALVFPPIAYFLALEWMYIDIRQAQTIKYLLKLEIKIPELELGWEEFKQSGGGFRYAIGSHGGVFIFTQILAMIVGFLRYDEGTNNWAFVNDLPSVFAIFLFIDCVCFIFTFVMFIERTRRSS